MMGSSTQGQWRWGVELEGMEMVQAIAGYTCENSAHKENRNGEVAGGHEVGWGVLVCFVFNGKVLSSLKRKARVKYSNTCERRNHQKRGIPENGNGWEPKQRRGEPGQEEGSPSAPTGRTPLVQTRVLCSSLGSRPSLLLSGLLQQ